MGSCVSVLGDITSSVIFCLWFSSVLFYWGTAFVLTQWKRLPLPPHVSSVIQLCIVNQLVVDLPLFIFCFHGSLSEAKEPLSSFFRADRRHVSDVALVAIQLFVNDVLHYVSPTAILWSDARLLLLCIVRAPCLSRWATVHVDSCSTPQIPIIVCDHRPLHAPTRTRAGRV